MLGKESFQTLIEPILQEALIISQENNVDKGDHSRDYNDIIVDEKRLGEMRNEHRTNLEYIAWSFTNIVRDLKKSISYGLFLVNSEGIVLEVMTNFDEKERQELGLELGQCWTLETKGTTATGMSLYYNKPMEIEGLNHYQKRYQQYKTIGLPIHNASGEIMYIVNCLVPLVCNCRVLDSLLFNSVQYIAREVLNNEYRQKIEEMNVELQRKNILYEKQKDLLGYIFDHVSDLVFIMDKEQALLKRNKQAQRFIEKHDLKSLRDIYKSLKVYDHHHQPISLEEDPVFSVFQGVRLVDYPFHIENEIGEKTYFSLNTMNYQGEEDKELAIGIFKDTTYCQWLEKQKREITQENQFMDGVMDALGSPVVVINYPHYRYELVNKVACSMIEQMSGQPLKEADVLGKSIFDMLPHHFARVITQEINEAVQQGSRLTVKVFPIPLQGELRHYKIASSLLKNESTDEVHVTVVGVDITEQIKLQQEAESLAKVKDEYVTIISHELRSPIAVIHTVVQMLKMEHYYSKLDERTRNLIKKVEKNCSRLLRLINNFLDVTKAEAGFMSVHLSSLDIVKYTEQLLESIQPIGQKKHISIGYYGDPSISEIMMDVNKYDRILLNLLSNAIKFTEEGGQIQVNLQDKNTHVELRVKDNGIGIAPEKIERIFDRFYIIDSSLSRSNEGSGIGLSLVKRFVDLLNGSIHVNSQVGKGTEFILSFPKAQHSTKVLEMEATYQQFVEKIYIEFSDIYL